MKFSALIRKPFRYAFWNAALVIIAVNMLVYLLTSLYPESSRYLALNPILAVRHGMFWQVFTYQFVHGSVSHLVFNMLGILFFGLAVERALGSREFILFYLLSGTLCGALSLFVYLLTATWYVFLMGASGALFALLLAYAVLYPDSVIFIWGIIPVPAPLLVLGYAAIELFSLLSGMNRGIAHGTHLLGFAAGWAYFLVRFGINPTRIWKRRR
jgi:membrane associated rhomboid family serine protease